MSGETPAKYFHGTSLQGLVGTSTAQTFGDLLAIIGAGTRLKITRAEFLALAKKERDRAKQVPFFVAACFRSLQSRRLYEEATVCNLIFLDIDDASDAALLLANRGLLYKALGRFNFAAYKTASSTAEKPRMRIVIEANALPKDRYAEAVETIGALLGLKRVTPESRSPVQPMYLPTLFSDSPRNEFIQ